MELFVVLKAMMKNAERGPKVRQTSLIKVHESRKHQKCLIKQFTGGKCEDYYYEGTKKSACETVFPLEDGRNKSGI
jgi:hypothetical protein